mmetsp:Transcript_3496/g.9836  ORF Transcript_3496/g.9836 Transcript_3496/m.9836 type:complete len:237 (-) Transcript_3496:725-1435(-)
MSSASPSIPIRSAPLYPAVLLAMSAKTCSETPDMPWDKISNLSWWLGKSSLILTSSLPGRRRAASTRSGLLVAARTKTPTRDSIPSSSVRNWLTTLSVTPVESCPRFGAMASNSSKKSMQGLAPLAFSKSSLTPASLAPMYLLRSSGPFTLMILKLQILAAHRTKKVLPHPGGPYNKAPVLSLSGHLSMRSLYLEEKLRRSSSWALAFVIPTMLSQDLTLSSPSEICEVPRALEGT